MKKDYGLQKGSRIGDLVVQSVQMQHVVKTTNEHYQFPTVMTVQLNGDGTSTAMAEALKTIQQHLDAPRIIYSEYGSPYECTIGAVQMMSNHADPDHAMKVKFEGKALRRRDIPTLKEVKQKEKEEERQKRGLSANDDQEPAQIAQLKSQGYRVISSHFAGAKCAVCGEVVYPGDKIAKSTSVQHKGGWAHINCAYQASTAASETGDLDS